VRDAIWTLQSVQSTWHHVSDLCWMYISPVIDTNTVASSTVHLCPSCCVRCCEVVAVHSSRLLPSLLSRVSQTGLQVDLHRNITTVRTIKHPHQLYLHTAQHSNFKTKASKLRAMQLHNFPYLSWSVLGSYALLFGVTSPVMCYLTLWVTSYFLK